MTLWSRSYFLALFFTCTWIIDANSQEDLYNYDNSLKFARYLKATHQYTYAIEEFERLHFFWPGDSTVTLELVQSYKLNSQCDRLEASLDLLGTQIFQNHSIPAAKEYLEFSLSCKSASSGFSEVIGFLEPGDQSYYKLSNLWLTKNHDSAFVYSHRNYDLLHAKSPDLLQLTYDLENEKYKSPALAVMMSTIIPGSGKAYSKRWGDAVISFLFVTTNAYASYRAFNKKGIKSVNGWIFGGLAFSFYSANLWGSAKAARIYNSQLLQGYQDHAESIIYNNF